MIHSPEGRCLSRSKPEPSQTCILTVITGMMAMLPSDPNSAQDFGKEARVRRATGSGTATDLDT
jgi:hypothetical protein